MSKKKNEEKQSQQAAPEQEQADEVQLSDIDEQVQGLKEQNEQLQDQMLRLRAEFENSRRRITRDAEQQVTLANEGLIEDLLPVLDDLDLFLANAEKEHSEQSLLEGARMIRQKLFDRLARRGLESLEAEGKPFDPELHEALLEMPTEEAAPGTVVSVQQRGYRLAGKLLRPSRVIIARAPDAEGEA